MNRRRLTPADFADMVVRSQVVSAKDSKIVAHLYPLNGSVLFHTTVDLGPTVVTKTLGEAIRVWNGEGEAEAT